MRNRFIVASLAVLFLTCSAAEARHPANAGPIPAIGLTREQVASWLQSKGYDARIDRDSILNDDYVAVNGADFNWGVYFYACDDSRRCTSLQYSVGWNGTSIPADKVNDWNRKKRFIRAYNSEDGTAVFGEMDFDVVPGGTWEMLDRTLSRFLSQAPNFKKFVLDGTLE